MPPIREYREPQSIIPESVAPGEISPQPQNTTDAMLLPGNTGSGPGQAIKAQTKKIFRRDGGELCIPSKDQITGLPVDECEPWGLGGVLKLAEREGHEDLLTKVLKHCLKDLNDWKSFLTSEPSPHKTTIICPPSESVRLDTTILHPIAAISDPTASSALDDECKLQTDGGALSYCNWDIMTRVLLTVLCLGCLAYHFFAGYQRRNHRMKKLRKCQQSKISKQGYPPDTTFLPSSSKLVEVNTNTVALPASSDLDDIKTK